MYTFNTPPMGGTFGANPNNQGDSPSCMDREDVLPSSDEDGKPKEDGANFWTSWLEAEPPVAGLREVMQPTADFLGIKIWDVRMKPNPSPEEEGETSSAYGNNFYFLVSPEATNGQSNPGFHLRWLIVHEMLHAYFWNLEQLLWKAFKEDEPAQNMLYRYWHGELDRLALALIPVIYPNFDPKEDLLNAPAD